MFTLGGVLYRLWSKSNNISSKLITYGGMKPPNILLFNQSKEEFTVWRNIFFKLLDPGSYTVYPLSNESFLNHPWLGTCCLLCCYVTKDFIGCDEKKELLKKYLVKYNGKLLLHGDDTYAVKNWLRSFGLREESIDADVLKFYSSDLSVVALHETICKNQMAKLKVILNEFHLSTKSNVDDCHIPCKQLPGYLYFADDLKISDVLDTELASKTMLLLRDKSSIPDESDETRFIIYSKNHPSFKPDFNLSLYYSYLVTRNYGRTILSSNLITSTQDFLKQLNVNTIKTDGLVVTAKQQSGGKGRTGNLWLSPEGCMMFSMQINIPVNSFLGNSLSIIQHLVVVAFVRAVKLKNEYFNELDVNIKWPNDVYLNKLQKIGGVVVNTSCLKNIFKVNLGLGVNISNVKPTYCVNQLILDYNEKTGYEISEFTVEEMLARTINEIETLVDLIQKEGVEVFLKEYYKYWLHSDVMVTLERHDNQRARVIGIDKNGYLRVQLVSTNDVVKLQPDGNSFDMMSNMIIIK